MAKAGRRTAGKGGSRARASGGSKAHSGRTAGSAESAVQLPADSSGRWPWQRAFVPIQLVERRWREELAPFLTVVLAALLLYAITAPRSVTLEDDSLFLMNLATWGVCHPPGYPLYSLLGSSFYNLLPSFIPPALRGHLFSSFCAALACGAVYAIVIQLVRSRLAGVFAGLALAVSDAFWSQAIIAEVYALNAAIFFLVLALCLRYASRNPVSEDPAGRKAHLRLYCAIAFAYGLGLSNHWPLLALGSVGLLMMVLSQRQTLIRRIPAGAACLLLGLLPYAYVVVRSQMDVAVSFYGPIDTPETLQFYVTRGGYSGVDNQAGVGLEEKLSFTLFLAGQIARQFTPAGLLVAAIGLVAMLRSRIHGWLACCLLVSWFMTGPLLLVLLNFRESPLAFSVFRVYHLLSYGIAAIWIGYGIAWLAGWLKRRAPAFPFAARAGLGLGALVVAAALAANWSRNNRADYAWARDLAMFKLVSVETGANLFTFDDLDMPVGYLSYVEQVRPDIVVYNDQGLIYGNRLYPPQLPEVRKSAALARFAAESGRPLYYHPVRTGLFTPEGTGSDFMGLWRRVNRTGPNDRIFLSDTVLFWLEHALDQTPAIADRWTSKQYFDVVGNLVSGLAQAEQGGLSMDTQWQALIQRAINENELAHLAALSARLDGTDFTAERAGEELAWIEAQLADPQRNQKGLDNGNYADMLAVAARIALRFPQAAPGKAADYIEHALVRSLDFKFGTYNVQFLADIYRAQQRWDDALAMLSAGYPSMSAAPVHFRQLYSQIAQEKATGRLQGPVLKLPD